MLLLTTTLVYHPEERGLLRDMRHVVTELRSGTVVRMQPGDWLELRLVSKPGFEWRVAHAPGHLLPVAHQPAERPLVLPDATLTRPIGFLAFAPAPDQNHGALVLELAHARRNISAEKRELAVIVA